MKSDRRDLRTRRAAVLLTAAALVAFTILEAAHRHAPWSGHPSEATADRPAEGKPGAAECIACRAASAGSAVLLATEKLLAPPRSPEPSTPVPAGPLTARRPASSLSTRAPPAASRGRVA